MKKEKTLSSVSKLTCIALLIALQVVLSRFGSISLWNLKLGLSFVPVMLAAYLFGAIPAALVYGVGDLVGSLLFPTGAYFPGFTVTAVLSGLIWGFALHNKIRPIRAVFAVTTVQLCCSFLLNSFWISYISGAPFLSLLATRSLQSFAYAGLHLVFIFLFLKRLGRLLKRIMKRI